MMNLASTEFTDALLEVLGEEGALSDKTIVSNVEQVVANYRLGLPLLDGVAAENMCIVNIK
jgi:hypothetical protein